MKRKFYTFRNLPLFEETCQSIIDQIDAEIRTDERFAENFGAEYTLDYIADSEDTGFFFLVVWTAEPLPEAEIKNNVLAEILRVLAQ